MEINLEKIRAFHDSSKAKDTVKEFNDLSYAEQFTVKRTITEDSFDISKLSEDKLKVLLIGLKEFARNS